MTDFWERHDSVQYNPAMEPDSLLEQAYEDRNGYPDDEEYEPGYDDYPAQEEQE